MNKDTQNVAIGTALKWTKICWCQEFGWEGTDPTGYEHAEMPDWTSNLNAMHETEKTLTGDQAGVFADYLAQATVGYSSEKNGTICFNGWAAKRFAHATAAQRAEAFLKTLDLWK